MGPSSYGMGNDFLYELGNFLDFSYGALNAVLAIILTITAIFSIAQCFFGYKIFKFWIGVIGFTVFGILGTALGALAFDGSMGAGVIVGLICGALGAFLAMKLYKLGVFIQCFTTGFIIGVILIGVLAQADIGPALAVAIVLGIIFGVIGVILIKPIIILSTGFSGGMTLGFCLGSLLGGNAFLNVLLGIIVSICGVLFQFYSDRNPRSVVKNQSSNPSNGDMTVDINISQDSDGTAAVATNSPQAVHKSNKHIEDINKKIDELVDRIVKKIKDKIETDSREVSEEENKSAIVDALKGLENFVYSNKKVKVVMPFIEYGLYAMAAFYCLRALGTNSTSAISMFTTIFLGTITLLCVIKGKKKSIAISFGLIAISQFIGMSKIHAFSYLPGKLVFSFILEEIIIVAIAALAAYSEFSKKKASV